MCENLEAIVFLVEGNIVGYTGPSLSFIRAIIPNPC